MSGGVDSSVAALLLQQSGVPVVGAYMKNWINEDNVLGDCPWQQDIVDARAVCDRLGIEFRVVNLMADYRRLVVDYLLDGYQRGLTPNPDVMCNSRVKFGVFRAYAEAEGFSALATGHYARRVAVNSTDVGRALRPISEIHIGDKPRPTANSDSAASGRFHLLSENDKGAKGTPSLSAVAVAKSDGRALPPFSLLEGLDKNKDQSYFLALLSQAQLRFARFPIGHLEKPELRALARAAGLTTAGKKDSQGICFIGEVKMADFLQAYVPDAPGPIVHASDGRELGQHRGLHFYTIGQRRGIRVPSNTDNEAYVVVGKRASDRALLVAFDHADAPGLFQTEVRVHSLSWTGEVLTTPQTLEGRVRYRDPRVTVEFIPTEAGSALIKFTEPQRGLASGQILALYTGEKLLGGGVYL